jgi:hypothetical protein
VAAIKKEDNMGYNKPPESLNPTSRKSRAAEIYHAIESLEEVQALLGDLIHEITSGPSPKNVAEKPERPPVPPMAQLIADLPQMLASQAAALERKTEELREMFI